ncbi:MAG: GGDEF domain-containing protein [Fibromonadaceae bacterium]|jgi:diguanylate cyclase (GGDEF)-like protein|nr:GGDEF domain-containing protein [Fibromonadaceae bacterium]
MSNKQKYLEHIQSLLRNKDIPELREELAEDPLLTQIHNELKTIREITLAFSSGDFSSAIGTRGFVSGCLKTLQANLRHLIWQVQMVEKGNFSQEIHFMGAFSTAFNNMVRQLKWSLTEQLKKENSLIKSEAYFKFLANHDPLTGVYNRRSFFELAEIRLAEAASQSIPCCLALMDIDHFKKFNDTYGHLAGDEALRQIVKTIEACLRKDDFMGRYGGEEFVLFFYNVDETTSLKIVERLRKDVAEHPVYLEKGPASVCASFGVVESSAENPNDSDYIQKLLSDADSALYTAKETGRNKAIFYKKPFFSR